MTSLLNNSQARAKINTGTQALPPLIWAITKESSEKQCIFSETCKSCFYTRHRRRNLRNCSQIIWKYFYIK